MSMFPTIETINDVLPYIEGRPEFRVTEKDWYTTINYMVAHDDTFDCPIRTECRGLIFDKSGKLISRPYHKFFNVGEKSYTSLDNVDLSEPHVILDKLDGSMIRPIPFDCGFRLGTKAGVTDVAMNAEVYIADKPNYSEFIEFMLAEGYTPIFEWISEENRIVVDYKTEDLILTAVRSNISGEYLSYGYIREVASEYNIPVVGTIENNCGWDVSKFVDTIRGCVDDVEGIIIRFNDGRMLKVKTVDYVFRHRSKETIRREKDIIALVLNDSVDDVLPLLESKSRDRLVAFASEFNEAISNFSDTLTDIFEEGYLKYPNAKDFAVEYVNAEHSRYSNFLFKMFRLGGSSTCRDIVIEYLLANISTSTKVDSVRWVFGGLSW